MRSDQSGRPSYPTAREHPCTAVLTLAPSTSIGTSDTAETKGEVR